MPPGIRQLEAILFGFGGDIRFPIGADMHMDEARVATHRAVFNVFLVGSR